MTVEGGELLAVGCACPYNERGFMTGETDTYYGEAMAVIKMTSDKASVRAADGRLEGSADIVAE